MGCISGIVKYFVFIVNSVFALAGLVLIILGSIIKYSLDDTLTSKAIPTEFDVASITVIVVGCIVFVTAFFGCWGSIKGNTCMLKTYAGILLTLLIIQVAMGVYVYIKLKDSDLRSDLEDILKKPFDKYQSKEYKEVVDTIQKNLECCGIEDEKFWDNKIPPSCCKSQKDCSATSNDIYKSGCLNELKNFMDSSFTVFVWVIIGIAATELCGAIFGIYLSRKHGHLSHRY